MKKFITFALIAAMMLTMLVANVSADAWDGTSVSESLKGEGTVASPYLVESAADLAFLAKSVDEGTTYAGKYITQTADIDLGNKEFPTIGNDGKQFQGVYDGKGFKITNFKGVVSEFDSGLFARVNSTADFQAAVINVTLEGSISEMTYANDGASPCVGALIGKLAGTAAKPAIVANCVVDVDINIEKEFDDSKGQIIYVGGIAGYVSHASVYNCVNKGDIKIVSTGKHNFVGGILAQTYNNITVEGCANYGDITSETKTGKLSLAGGIIGRTNCYVNTAYSLANNVNYGEITAKSSASTAYASGVIAQVFLADNQQPGVITVDSCANTGKLHAEAAKEGQNAYAGGILAYENIGSTTVKNCAGSGEVTAAGVNKTMLPGYVVGVSNPKDTRADSSVKDCVATGKANGWFGAKAKAENCTSDADAYTVASAIYEIEKAAFATAKVTVNGTDYSYSAKAIAEPVAPVAPAPAPTPDTGDVTSVIVLALVAVSCGAVLTLKKTR